MSLDLIVLCVLLLERNGKKSRDNLVHHLEDKDCVSERRNFWLRAMKPVSDTGQRENRAF